MQHKRVPWGQRRLVPWRESVLQCGGVGPLNTGAQAGTCAAEGYGAGGSDPGPPRSPGGPVLACYATACCSLPLLLSAA